MLWLYEVLKMCVTHGFKHCVTLRNASSLNVDKRIKEKLSFKYIVVSAITATMLIDYYIID